MSIGSTPMAARSLLGGLGVLRLVVLISALCGVAQAYIPAQATNDTQLAQQDGLNISDKSHLDLLWFPMGGSYSESVSYQLVGSDGTGLSRGALVHFSEWGLTNETTNTPWIALVSCDANSTDASDEDDIFTLARDRGAVGALLYSLKSEACIINPFYSDPANFDQVMDIFSTKSLTSSKLIEGQFTAVNQSKYYSYNAGLLNKSANDIYAVINGSAPRAGYLFASLIAYNATDPGLGNPVPDNLNPNGGRGGGNTEHSGGTSIAMIILYAITGCVSALFCVVIVSGAIRAIRHPERYGPRAGGAEFGGPPGMYGAQSRARGITRAILDTFPIVKFGRNEEGDGTAAPRGKDLEAADTSMAKESIETASVRSRGIDEELRTWQIAQRQLEGDEGKVASGSTDVQRMDGEAGSSQLPAPVPRPKKKDAGAAEKDVVPDAIGRETCPICIVDFEEGDDLRVLPCEGHHRFHRECVDQWLLDLSSSCPICRQDFQALQTMMSAGDMEHLEPPHMPGAARPLSSAAARFSRYLRFARRRHRGQAGEMSEQEARLSGYDPTNPPMRMAPQTTLRD